MGRKIIIAIVAMVACLTTAGVEQAKAQCAMPYTLTNGTVADATQVMGNFNALVTCLTAAVASGTSGQVAYYPSTGAAVAGESLSALIDSSIGSTRGAILERGASGWVLIAPGTSGYVLTSNGTGADPTYQAGGGGGGPTNTPAIVQSASAGANNAAASVTLSSSPAAGNLLLFIVGINNNTWTPSGSDIPANTYMLGNGPFFFRNSGAMAVYAHVVQSGDGTSWSFTVPSSGSIAVWAIEISNAGLPHLTFQDNAYVQDASVTATAYTPAANFDTKGGLSISAFTIGFNQTDTGTLSVASPWTLIGQQSGGGSYTARTAVAYLTGSTELNLGPSWSWSSATNAFGTLTVNFNKTY